MAEGVAAVPARITVRLTPRGGRNVIDGWDGDTLRVRVTSAPVDGKANDAMLRLLAKALGLPPSRISLVSGAQARVKTIEVDGLSTDELRRALGA